jgi:hypothetical protein
VGKTSNRHVRAEPVQQQQAACIPRYDSSGAQTHACWENAHSRAGRARTLRKFNARTRDTAAPAVVRSAATYLKSVWGNMWNAIRDWRRKRKLRAMLTDPRSARGVRSIGQLEKGIGADRTTTERLLLGMGAKQTTAPEEWTLAL